MRCIGTWWPKFMFECSWLTVMTAGPNLFFFFFSFSLVLSHFSRPTAVINLCLTRAPFLQRSKWSSFITCPCMIPDTSYQAPILTELLFAVKVTYINNFSLTLLVGISCFRTTWINTPMIRCLSFSFVYVLLLFFYFQPEIVAIQPWCSPSLGSGHGGGSRLSRVFQTSVSPATFPHFLQGDPGAFRPDGIHI